MEDDATSIGQLVLMVLSRTIYIPIILKKHSLIQIPGSWDTLLVILIIFIAEYYLGYEKATNPILVAQFSFKVSLLVLSGVCTGLFLGRLFCYKSHYKDDAEIDFT